MVGGIRRGGVLFEAGGLGFGVLGVACLTFADLVCCGGGSISASVGCCGG